MLQRKNRNRITRISIYRSNTRKPFKIKKPKTYTLSPKNVGCVYSRVHKGDINLSIWLMTGYELRYQTFINSSLLSAGNDNSITGMSTNLKRNISRNFDPKIGVEECEITVTTGPT